VAPGTPGRLDIQIRSEVIRQFGGHKFACVIDDTLAANWR
jgi:citrate lyase gamma subunit